MGHRATDLHLSSRKPFLFGGAPSTCHSHSVSLPSLYFFIERRVRVLQYSSGERIMHTLRTLSSLMEDVCFREKRQWHAWQVTESCIVLLLSNVSYSDPFKGLKARSPKCRADGNQQAGLCPRAAGANRYGALNGGVSTVTAANFILVSQRFWRRRWTREVAECKENWRNKGTKPEGTEGEETRTKRQSKRTMFSPNGGKSPIFLGASFLRPLEQECLGEYSVLPQYCWQESICRDCTSSGSREVTQRGKSALLLLQCKPSPQSKRSWSSCYLMDTRMGKKTTSASLYCTKYSFVVCRNERFFIFHLHIILIRNVLMLWKLPRNAGTSLRL